jgi:hypothetical protein
VASLRDLSAPVTTGMSMRFVVVGYFPTYAAVLFLLMLVWAGAPGGDVSMNRLVATAEQLSVTVLLLLSVGILLVAFVVHPLQLALVRVLEGYWPNVFPFDRLTRRAAARQAARRAALARRTVAMENMTSDESQAALAAGLELSRRFPPENVPLLPTALGNVLRAGEALAGQSYGFEAVTTWPRLYPVLGDRVRAIVDDRRNTLDLTCRLAVTFGVAGVLSVGLLAWSGAALVIAAAPLMVAALAYRSGIEAAVGYGEALAVAFDLHRFDLLRALHLPLPAEVGEERKQNEQLSRFWDQGVPLDPTPYEHETPPTGPAQDGRADR